MKCCHMNKGGKYLFALLWILVSIGGLYSCSSPYTRMVREELASGVKNDSIFLGMYFGDSTQLITTNSILNCLSLIITSKEKAI